MKGAWNIVKIWCFRLEITWNCRLQKFLNLCWFERHFVFFRRVYLSTIAELSEILTLSTTRTKLKDLFYAFSSENKLVFSQHLSQYEIFFFFRNSTLQSTHSDCSCNQTTFTLKTKLSLILFLLRIKGQGYWKKLIKNDYKKVAKKTRYFLRNNGATSLAETNTFI